MIPQMAQNKESRSTPFGVDRFLIVLFRKKGRAGMVKDSYSAGCCWVTQWTMPPNSARSMQLMPTT